MLWHNTQFIYVLTSRGRQLQIYRMPELRPQALAGASFPTKLPSHVVQDIGFGKAPKYDIVGHDPASCWKFPNPDSPQYGGLILRQGVSRPRSAIAFIRTPFGNHNLTTPPIPKLCYKENLNATPYALDSSQVVTSFVTPSTFAMLSTFLARSKESASLMIQGFLCSKGGHGEVFSLVTDLAAAEWEGAWIPSHTTCFRSGKLLVSQLRDEMRPQVDGSETKVEEYYHALLDLDDD